MYFEFPVPDSGRLDMAVDWTHASSRIGVYLVPANTCTLDQFNARSCNLLVRSEPPGSKPRKASAPNVAAGNYRWMVGSFSDVKESASLQIVLSKGECPPLAGGEPSASAQGSTLRSASRIPVGSSRRARRPVVVTRPYRDAVL